MSRADMFTSKAIRSYANYSIWPQNIGHFWMSLMYMKSIKCALNLSTERAYFVQLDQTTLLTF